MEYILIKLDDIFDFNNKVNLRLKDGWKLHGDTFSYKFNDIMWHTQAMIKHQIETQYNTDLQTVEQIMASWNV